MTYKYKDFIVAKLIFSFIEETPPTIKNRLTFGSFYDIQEETYLYYGERNMQDMAGLQS